MTKRHLERFVEFEMLEYFLVDKQLLGDPVKNFVGRTIVTSCGIQNVLKFYPREGGGNDNDKNAFYMILNYKTPKITYLSNSWDDFGAAVFSGKFPLATKLCIN